MFPTIEIVSEPIIVNNDTEATFKVKVVESVNGIKRIELWLNGKKIDKYTKNYVDGQTEVIQEFRVSRNGDYTIKAYADLKASKDIAVAEIMPKIQFLPNEDRTYKKEHTVEIIIDKTKEAITEMK